MTRSDHAAAVLLPLIAGLAVGIALGFRALTSRRMA